MEWRQIETCAREFPEASAISEFLGRRGRGISYLMKQDKNIDFCIESFWALYKNFEGYKLKLVIDSDGESGIRKLRDRMQTSIKKDVLIQDTQLENMFYFKGLAHFPAVFLYPKTSTVSSGKLTDLVRKEGCGNLAGCRDADERKDMLSNYLETKPEWIEEFTRFLLM